jgi:hypothetical protein
VAATVARAVRLCWMRSKTGKGKKKKKRGKVMLQRILSVLWRIEGFPRELTARNGLLGSINMFSTSFLLTISMYCLLATEQENAGSMAQGKTTKQKQTFT